MCVLNTSRTSASQRFSSARAHMRRHTSHQAVPESEWACPCALSEWACPCALRLAIWTCEEGNAEERDAVCMGRERRCMYGMHISSLRLTIVNSSLRARHLDMRRGKRASLTHLGHADNSLLSCAHHHEIVLSLIHELELSLAPQRA